MKAVAVLLVIVALTSAETSEDDRINLAYAKHLKNAKLIGLKAGEETTLVQQEQFALTNKPAVPAWVSSEDDLEAFLQEEAMAGKKIVRRVTGVAQAGSVPEATMVQEDESAETPEFKAATAKVSTMLEVDTMARRSACVKAADASINNVFTDVKNAQRLLNKLNNGRHCATRNQHLINRAKRTISLRSRQVRSSLNYLRQQRRSRVRWNFSFESLREGSCSAFYRSGQWQSSKRRVSHANRRLVSARANLRAARNNLKVQIRNAKRARNRCRCGVKKRVARELKSAKRLTGDRMKTLLREMMVKCLVAARKRGKNANKYASRCKSLRVSASYKRRLRLYQTRLAPGVAAARCSAGRLLLGGARTLRRNTRLSSNFRTTSEYDLSFDIRPMRKVRGWANILHFSKRNANYGHATDRSPAIWFYSNTYRLHIRQGRKGHVNDGCDPRQQLPHNRWTTVKVSLRKTRMQVFFNGRNVCNGPAYKDAISPQSGMKVYAADPWYHAAGAQLRNLRYAPVTPRKRVSRVRRSYGGRVGFSQRLHKNKLNKPACAAMRRFRSGLSARKSYRGVRVTSVGKGSFTCNSPSIATKICRAVKNASKLNVKCAGKTWAVGTCGAANGGKGMEINVATKFNGRICQCQKNGFTLRPCIGHTNSNWGGFGNSCGGAVAQTMQLSCY